MPTANNAINNTVGATISGVTNSLTVSNSSNTSSSSARKIIAVGGSSAGDPFLSFNVNSATDWSFGIDNDDSDFLKMAASNSLGTNDRWIAHTNGEITLPKQSFAAGSSIAQSNATGDGTEVIVSFNFFSDRHGDTSGNTFVCPIDGLYRIFYNQELNIPSSSYSDGEVGIAINGVSDGITYNKANYSNIRAQFGANTPFVVQGIITLKKLSQGDVIQGRVKVSGGSKSINIRTNSNFSCLLLM